MRESKVQRCKNTKISGPLPQNPLRAVSPETEGYLLQHGAHAKNLFSLENLMLFTKGENRL